jgi:3-hydroxyacyl-[acyl-carrier-protein] dehydratase
MLLSSQFYNYQLIEQNDNQSYVLKLHFNAQHEIFIGHFPNNPVVPGVTMVQLVKEVISEVLQKPIHLENISLIKFLKVIDPRIDIDYTLIISLQTNDSKIKCDAHIKDEANSYFKMKSSYIAL